MKKGFIMGDSHSYSRILKRHFDEEEFEQDFDEELEEEE